MPKRTYSDSFKEQILQEYSDYGPKAVCDKYGISKGTLMCMRKRSGVDKFTNSHKKSGRTRRTKAYSASFKLRVLDYFEDHTAKETEDQFNLNSNNFYKWRTERDKLLKEQEKEKEKEEGKVKEEQEKMNKSIGNLISSVEDHIKIEVKEDNHDPDPIQGQKRSSEQKKLEVLEYFLKFGQEQTMKKYSIKPKRLHNWRVAYNDYFCGRLMTHQTSRRGADWDHKVEVLEYAKEHGIKKATEEYNVPIPKIWDWRSKYNKKLKITKKRIKSSSTSSMDCKIPREKKEFSEDLKKTVVEEYKEHGMKATAARFGIARQTIRGWVIKQGADVIHDRSSIPADERKAVIEMAKTEGVKSALEKHSISRATLYNWANKINTPLVINNDGQSVTLNVVHAGKKRKIIFWKKKVKPPKPPKPPRVKKEKPVKPVKPKEDLGPRPELPDWARDFIKSKVPTVKRSETPDGEVTYLVDEKGTILEGEGFILSSVNDKESDSFEDKEEIATDDSDDEEEVFEYECDYVDIDWFNSLPFFTPNNL